jgi:hypothetical protein
MKTTLPENVLAALTHAQRLPGWNLRPARVMRFDLPRPNGTACRLLVVPYRRWVDRRTELQAPQHHRGGNAA